MFRDIVFSLSLNPKQRHNEKFKIEKHKRHRPC